MPRSQRFRKNKPKPVPYQSQQKKKNRKFLLIGGLLALIVIVVGVFLVGVNSGWFLSTSPSVSPSPTLSATDSASASPTSTPDLSQATTVVFQTSLGNFTVKLREDKPITSGNFRTLALQGFYDGTIFHRVIENFMIQGGLNASSTAATISDEIGSDNHNLRGTIAMANTGQPNSASSSFFINVKDNSDLDSGYAVFGTVTEGMDVVDAISHVSVGVSPYIPNEMSYPQTTIMLIKATVLP